MTWCFLNPVHFHLSVNCWEEPPASSKLHRRAPPGTARVLGRLSEGQTPRGSSLHERRPSPWEAAGPVRVQAHRVMSEPGPEQALSTQTAGGPLALWDHRLADGSGLPLLDSWP